MSRLLFFSGKGGVGKTSLSAAVAVRLAGRGLRTLLVTTDPASNLGDVFEQTIGAAAEPVPALPALWLQEIDPAEALRAYRQRALAPVQGLLPEEMLRSIEEQMSGPCTEEIAAFDRFVACLEDGNYDRIVFDTAPTGHTLRLLELPAAWSLHIEASSRGSGQTCIGPVEALSASRAQYDRAVALLRSPTETRFVLVTQPERTSVEETERARRELLALGIRPQALVVNGLIPPEAADNDFFRSRLAMQERLLGQIHAEAALPVLEMPLWDFEIRGLRALNMVGERLEHAGFLF